ncbi:MAG: hypothetical protein ACRYG7_14920 [Janthinobacterium lividum]
MKTAEPCQCAGCLAGFGPDHQRKLVAIGALPDPAFQPYPQPTISATTSLLYE